MLRANQRSLSDGPGNFTIDGCEGVAQVWPERVLAVRMRRQLSITKSAVTGVPPGQVQAAQVPGPCFSSRLAGLAAGIGYHAAVGRDAVEVQQHGPGFGLDDGHRDVVPGEGADHVCPAPSASAVADQVLTVSSLAVVMPVIAARDDI